ncbi:hypothetical protein X943_001216 [Babesia divergens]|uniref:Uncharacterized protein n=1 Tax=Babesia divergens TaxID=32595 RepID=A0AAD9GAF1_BABDI|nr:hypothetical protein X943_001216 [Babesia divergens]
MAMTQLDDIWIGLKSAMDDTDALYRSVQLGPKQMLKPGSATPKRRVRFGDIPAQHINGNLMHSTPVNAAGKGAKYSHKNANAQTTAATERPSWDQNAEYMTYATNSAFFRSLNVDFEGWTEAQRQQFYKLVSSAENHMHAESERLQREYSLQLERKLQYMRKEMAEARRSATDELAELRLDRERLSFDDVENRRALKLTKDSLQNLQKSYDNLMEECGIKSSEIIRLNAVVATTERSFLNLKQRTLQLENDLNEKLQQVESLHQDVANAYKQMEATSSNNTRTEHKLTCTMNDLKNTQEEVVHLKLDMEALQLNNQLILNEKDALQSKNRSLEREIAELTAEKLRLDARVQTLEDDTIASLRQQCKQLEEQLNAARMEAVACDKRQEVARLKRELESSQYQSGMFTEDNKALLKENAILTKQLQDLQKKMKDTDNELFQLRCKTHLMRQKGYQLPQPTIAPDHSSDVGNGTLKDQEASTAPEKPFRRDIFAPTMFNAPDPEAQEQIDALEGELTQLHLEKDRMISEMTRCHIGPMSPAAERRRHYLLECSVKETNKKMQEITESIRKLQVPI